MIHAAFPEIEHRPFGKNTRQIVSALLPGFAASVGALARLGDARRAVALLLDTLEDGAIVFDANGEKVLARNSAMGELLRQEPDSVALEKRLAQSALAAVRQPSKAKLRNPQGGPEALSAGWCSKTGTPYRLRTIHLPVGSVGKGEAITVIIQRVGPTIPTLGELITRFNLTQREAEVAHGLALGHSDREIAAALNLSRHTVRHHAEAVFVKVGVTSRKALILHLGAPGADSDQ